MAEMHSPRNLTMKGIRIRGEGAGERERERERETDQQQFSNLVSRLFYTLLNIIVDSKNLLCWLYLLIFTILEIDTEKLKK